ncbi:hypothetical protein HOLleu_39686 [Holothuria leucospilota]|uniref:Uncharacterized protein n=1 Tax=Holothuria leucospilota TaxID=206669 RepID=A0A9Q0YCB9_HOLLE|nr:hypothetical protein HOLleu_39686 [Holothuria leucospilota]
MVQEQVTPRSFLVKIDQGFLLRRNRWDLKKVKLEEPSGSNTVDGSMGKKSFQKQLLASPDSCQEELRC